jgi:FkbM family methyltransferase
MRANGGLPAELFAEILRDSHRYTPGVEQNRPTLVKRDVSNARRLAALAREHSRDLVERIAERAGFTRRHFDPDVAGTRLARLQAMSAGLGATRALLADDHSRRAFDALMKLCVLGPYHTSLAITPTMYRDKQGYADRELRTRAGTYEVSDPWFNPLSLYQVPVDGGPPVSLHGHSVDIVSVFLLDQYTYKGGGNRVGVEPGDVVLDIGGCWGDTALYFASLVGDAGKVYTFEFDPESLEIMHANLALNPELASRIEVVERAMWERSGETLHVVQAGRMTTVLPDGGDDQSIAVPTITLDDFVEQEGIEPGFVKMDVEGAELSVLSGARETLARVAPKLAIAAYHKDDDLVRIPEAIMSEGADYRLYIDTFSPVEEETVLFATAAKNST